MIRRLGPDDAAILRELRLGALADAPRAFGSTYDGTVGRSDDEWEALLRPQGSPTFVWEGDDGPAGMVVPIDDPDEPDVLHLNAMWVHPSARGRGAGDALVEHVLTWAAERNRPRVLLDVVADNERAIALYRRHGFVPTGREWTRDRDGATELEMAAEAPGSGRWESLRQWGTDAVRCERLSGGVANDVWSVRVGGRLAIARLGTRSDADLAWETDLMVHLDRAGMTVPVPISTVDGRPFVDGLVVMTYVEGRPPESEDDWRRVADTLRELHRLTEGWPQRPGWRSSTELLHARTGTKVDLDAMPHEGVARCRAAWERLVGRPTSVVHGDPNRGNIRLTADRVGLIDWDESRVDASLLDLVLPHHAAGLADDVHDLAAQASAAWEAAVCWDDDHAIRCLAEVRPI